MFFLLMGAYVALDFANDVAEEIVIPAMTVRKHRGDLIEGLITLEEHHRAVFTKKEMARAMKLSELGTAAANAELRAIERKGVDRCSILKKHRAKKTK